LQNCFLNAFGVRKDFIVPKADDAPAAFFEPSGAPLVSFIISMLPTVRLDDDAMRDANEIDDERTDRTLTTKFVTGKPTASQSVPQTPFGIRHIDS